MSFPTPFFKWRPHPWHGLELGKNPPFVVNAYIEITPFDFVKYEVEKITGYLRVDRPHRTSSQPPSLYGFIPKTYCGNRVRDLSPSAKKGDGDPLDICIITERPINKSEIILDAKVVGGIQMIDHKEADDKIIAVLLNDNVWQNAENISDLPKVMIDRLRHYFLTYKLIPGEKPNVQIDSIYDREHALKVVEASILDYKDEYDG
ncbi:MAG: inorganic pyrophosphatase [Ignavibacteriae bacterium]|nr:inorganic pyrophosphatase [Ignavibacteriota bacterium]